MTKLCDTAKVAGRGPAKADDDLHGRAHQRPRRASRVRYRGLALLSGELEISQSRSVNRPINQPATDERTVGRTKKRLVALVFRWQSGEVVALNQPPHRLRTTHHMYVCCDNIASAQYFSSMFVCHKKTTFLTFFKVATTLLAD